MARSARSIPLHKPREKTRVKALRASKGYPAAVKLAKRLASG
jgi:hypothetical protein